MKRWAGALLFALVAALTPVAHAAPSVLVLTGSRTAAVDVVLTKPARLDPHLLRFTTSGSYAGLAVHDAAGVLLTATINVQRWLVDANPAPPAIAVTREVTLPRGRYRLSLITDGASRVEIPATGGFAKRFAPGGPSRAVARLTDLRAGAPGRTDFRAPVTLRPDGGAVLVEHARSTARQARSSRVCFAAPAAPDCTDADGTMVESSSPGMVGDGYEQSAVLVYGDLGGASRRLDALVQTSVVDVPRVLDALLLTL